MTIGERIRSTRESQQISQTDLATKIGVSKQTLYKYETNIITNIPSDIIEKISAILNTSPSVLMGWEKKDNDTRTYPPRLNILISKAKQLNSKGLEALVKQADLLLLSDEYKKIKAQEKAI